MSLGLENNWHNGGLQFLFQEWVQLDLDSLMFFLLCPRVPNPITYYTWVKNATI